VQAEPFHPAQRRAASAVSTAKPVGLDRGLHAFAVAATAEGHELWRSCAPKPLAHHLRALRRLSRRHSRAKRDGKNRQRRVHELQRLHARITHIRQDYTHKLASTVVKTHAHVAIENLNIAGMVRCRSLARAIADVSWGSFAHKLAYKADWYGTQLTSVDRFFPSSKTCHRCQYVVSTLTLADRTFVCPACHLAADRDTNAAANCAAFAATLRPLAAKQVERLNARREEGSGGARPERRETNLDEAGTALGYKPEGLTPEKGGVGTLNVNTL
jgi:putative transposase